MERLKDELRKQFEFIGTEKINGYTALKIALQCIEDTNGYKMFCVTYRYTNRTDASLHEENVIAFNCVEACNKVCENHNYEVEWHTVEEIEK